VKSRHCSRCGGTLCATQPDERDYVRTLLVCDDCGRWYCRIAVPGRRATTTPLPVATLAELGLEPVDDGALRLCPAPAEAVPPGPRLATAAAGCR
jgi:hypothetical protein